MTCKFKVWFKDLSIWSESNWSEFAKQFNKSIQFPLPGQIGVITKSNNSNKQVENLIDINKTVQNKKSLSTEEIVQLLNKNILQESQFVKLREATEAIYYLDKMENLLSAQKDSLLNKFEIKAYKCPKSLTRGWLLFS